MAEASTVPSGFGGGLTRFNEEYNSKIKFSPSAVVVMVILLILFVFSLKYIFPIN